MILAGNLDRTKSSLALFEAAGGEPRLLRSAVVENGEFPGIRPLLRRFVAQDLAALRVCCLCVEAEPPWPLAAPEVAAALGLSKAELIGPEVAGAEWLSRVEPESLASSPNLLWGAAWRAFRHHRARQRHLRS